MGLPALSSFTHGCCPPAGKDRRAKEQKKGGQAAHICPFWRGFPEPISSDATRISLFTWPYLKWVYKGDCFCLFCCGFFGCCLVFVCFFPLKERKEGRRVVSQLHEILGNSMTLSFCLKLDYSPNIIVCMRAWSEYWNTEKDLLPCFPFTAEQKSKICLLENTCLGSCFTGVKPVLSAAKVIIFLNYQGFASCYVSCQRLNLADDFPQSFQIYLVPNLLNIAFAVKVNQKPQNS